MTLIEQTANWLKTLPFMVGFRYSAGAWTEQPGRVAAIWNDGGRNIPSDADFPVLRIVLGSDRDGRDDALPLLDIAQQIRDAAPDACIGPSVRVTPIGGIVGPGYTTEGRAWVEFNLEFLI